MKQMNMQEDLSFLRHFELFRIPLYGFLLCFWGKNVLTHFLYSLSNLILTTFSWAFKPIVHQNERRKTMKSFLWQTWGELSHLWDKRDALVQLSKFEVFKNIFKFIFLLLIHHTYRYNPRCNLLVNGVRLALLAGTKVRPIYVLTTF